jgi:hypothetical protein
MAQPLSPADGQCRNAGRLQRLLAPLTWSPRMTSDEYLDALRAAAEAGDVQAVAILRTMESWKPRRPFDCLPAGL